MSREQDKRIAEWLGYTVETYLHHIETRTRLCIRKPSGLHELPNYTTSDADAITLLPVLVERGYGVGLMSNMLVKNWAFNITPPSKYYPNENTIWSSGTTIAQTISSAVIALIERESTNDN